MTMFAQKTTSPPSDKNNKPTSFHLQENKIKTLEKIWGKGYLSANDDAIIEEIFYPCFPRKKETILEIDSGLGSHLTKIKKKFQLYVDGIERNPHFYNQPLKDNPKLKNKIIFHNISEKPTSKSYEIIFAKNKFHCYPDKAQLFTNLLFSLKPNGKLIFSDFFFPTDKAPDELRFAQRWIRHQKADKFITNIKDYATLLTQNNFKTHIRRDISAQFMKLASESFKTAFARMKKQSFTADEKKTLLETYQSFYSMLEAITKKELYIFKIHAERIM